MDRVRSIFPVKSLIVSAAALLAVVVARLVWPAEVRSDDLVVRQLQDRQRALAGFPQAQIEMERRVASVRSALWDASAEHVTLPPGWTARALPAEEKPGVRLLRYAFFKDCMLGDYGEFVRVLKSLEEKPSTRIDAVTLTLNADGRRFSTALITATLPMMRSGQ